MGPKWDKMGLFLGDFGPFLGRSVVILGSLTIILASFWHHFGVGFGVVFGVVCDLILRLFWDTNWSFGGFGSKMYRNPQPHFEEDT